MTVAIVGGGAVGTTLAYDLATAGEDVVLYERGEIGNAGDGPAAAGSSPRAAGICYDAYADRRDAAIAKRALERFRSFSSQGSFEFADVPYLWLARSGDHDREQAIWQATERMAAHDLDVEVLDRETISDRYPSVTVDDIGVAAVANQAGCTDPATYPPLLADLAAQAGATVHERTSVRVEPDGTVIEGASPEGAGQPEASTTDQVQYDDVVIAAGASSKLICADAGIDLAMKPYRVQALTASVDYNGPTVYDASAGVYLRPHSTGLLAGDGTIPREADPADWRRDADESFVRTTRARLHERLSLSERALEIDRAWAGLCAATPDRNPLVGQLDAGLYIAAGWQGHGFMRAPAIAERLAEQLLGDDDGISGFDPTRFTGDEEFKIVEGMAVE